MIEPRDRNTCFCANIAVPSKNAQTLSYRATFEHALRYADVACFALTSKSIQNSSLGANAAVTYEVNRNTVPLFVGVFHPSRCFSVQLAPELRVDFSSPPLWKKQQPFAPSNEVTDERSREFCSALGNTKYFRKSLRTLIMNSCSEVLVADLLLQHPPSASSEALGFTQLQKFEGHSLNIGETPFFDLCSKALSNVTDFTFDNNRTVPADRLAKGLAQMPHLEHLSLCFSLRATNDLIDDLAATHAALQLKSIFFNGSDEIDTRGISSLCAKFPNLTSLGVSGHHADDQVLFDIAANLHDLTNLELCACSEITDEGIICVAQNLHNLTHLNLTWSPRVTEKCFADVAIGLPNLTKFALYGKEELLDKDEFYEALDALKKALPNCHIGM